MNLRTINDDGDFNRVICILEKEEKEYAEIYKEHGKEIRAVCHSRSDQLFHYLLCGINDHQPYYAGALL